MENKLLSIVMPTYNRCNMLAFTLSLLKDQVIRMSHDVELIICDNASNDKTYGMLKSMHEKDPYFALVHYDTHKEIGESILRSIDNAKGKFFLLWSDDDIPSPSMIDILVDRLYKHPDIECITFNRVQ